MSRRYRDLAGAGDSSGVVAQIVEQRQRLAARLANVRHTVAIMSGKGGVGKSAITANLAAALAVQGYAVGAVDADINGPSLARMLGGRGQRLVVRDGAVQPAIGVADIKVMSMDLLLPFDETPVTWKHGGGLAGDTYVWRGTLEANTLRELLADTDWGALDFLFLDLPPGPDRFSTVAQVLPDLDGVVVVTIPAAVSHLVVKKTVSVAREHSARLTGLVENMAGYFCQTCGDIQPLFPNADTRGMAEAMELPYLGAVPFDPRMAEASDRGIPFVLEYGETPAGEVLGEIAAKVEHALGD
jgi:ATP-binding protein involved in chromosome partitioning